jgi:hypothetical protein
VRKLQLYLNRRRNKSLQSVLELNFFTVYGLHHELRDGSDVFEGSGLVQQRDKVPGFEDIVVEVRRGSFVKRLPDGALDYVGSMPSPSPCLQYRTCTRW